MGAGLSTKQELWSVRWRRSDEGVQEHEHRGVLSVNDRAHEQYRLKLCCRLCCGCVATQVARQGNQLGGRSGTRIVGQNKTSCGRPQRSEILNVFGVTISPTEASAPKYGLAPNIATLLQWASLRGPLFRRTNGCPSPQRNHEPQHIRNSLIFRVIHTPRRRRCDVS